MFASELDESLYDTDDAVDWDQARCQSGGGLTELFFSDQLADIAQAKAICAECQLVQPCLDGALARREPWGVWGGQLFANGRVLAQKRRRGRPPKHPRPDDLAGDSDISLTA